MYALVLIVAALVGVVSAQNMTIPFNFPLFKQVSFGGVVWFPFLAYRYHHVFFSATRSGAMTLW
jgi:hypothetical protein